MWVLPRQEVEPAAGVLDLLRAGAVEYIDPQQQEVVIGRTHAELDATFILGLSAGRIPFLHHNAATKNVIASEMCHQAVGMMRVPFLQGGGRGPLPLLLESTSYFLHYPQHPLARTRLDRELGLPPDVCNVYMIMLAPGANQEDSYVLSVAAVDRGLWRSTNVRVFTVACEKGQSFSPGPKLGADGLVDVGQRVFARADGSPGSPLCRRVEADTGREFVTLYREHEGGVVAAVLRFEDERGRQACHVVVHSLRRPQVGDKFASRHGQKGVVGAIVPPEDLPFDRRGVVPDMIMNPHAWPSRMTLGHAIEMRVKGPADAFEHVDVPCGGEELFYNGKTGEPLRARVFGGDIAMMRLRHMTAGKVHVAGLGTRINARTRQPVQGRAKDGGLRVGEMEGCAIRAHGAAEFLRERFGASSDGVPASYCMQCGRAAEDVCRLCGATEFRRREENYSLHLVLAELSAMGLGYSDDGL